MAPSSPGYSSKRRAVPLKRERSDASASAESLSLFSSHSAVDVSLDELAKRNSKDSAGLDWISGTLAFFGATVRARFALVAFGVVFGASAAGARAISIASAVEIIVFSPLLAGYPRSHESLVLAE